MNLRGRKASLPRAGHARPEYVSSDGLVVHHYNRDGRVKDYDFSRLPVAEPLQRSFAALFADRCVPHIWAIKAAATASRFAGTVITATTARRLIANEDAMIYDNPHALVLCHYKRSNALCHRDGVKDTPSLDHCVPGCGNIVRTDQHAIQLRERATALEVRAARVPGPLGERLRGNADKLRGYAHAHDQTCITLTEDAG